MTKDVKNKGRVNGVFSNAQFFTQGIVMRRNSLWYIHDIKIKPICEKGWKKIVVANDYLIATDEENNTFLLHVEDRKLVVDIEGVAAIKPIQEDYFIVEKNDQKAVYKGKVQLIDFDYYDGFEVDFDFQLIIIKRNGLYGAVDLAGKRLMAEVFDEIEPWKDSKVQLLKHRIGDKWGLYKVGRGVIIECVMNQIIIHSQYIECILENKIGIYNFSGIEVIPVKYARIRAYGKVFKVALKSGSRYLYGAFDLSGRKILECKFPQVKVDLEKGTVEGVKFINHVVKRIS